MVPPERTLIITAADLLEATADVARQLPPENVIGEPVPQNGRLRASALDNPGFGVELNRHHHKHRPYTH